MTRSTASKHERRVLVAPDSFKGTFTATEVADAIGRGLRAAGAQVDLCPVADGGEGTMVVLLAALGGRAVEVQARDPLGRPVQALLGLLDDGVTAIVETAQASGLGLVSDAERDPETASTYGTGELVGAAISQGARRVLVTLGGSATTDGGLGAIDAIRAAGGTRGAQLTLLCDVEVPYEKAAEVFAPQKGADSAAVTRLTARLQARATELPRDPRGVPMTGAAGGLSGGLWAAFDATLVSGAAFVLDAVGFTERLADGDAVVAGEGRLDHQSLDGKIVSEIATRAMAAAVPVHVIAGSSELSAQQAADAGIASVTLATNVDELVEAGSALAHRL